MHKITNKKHNLKNKTQNKQTINYTLINISTIALSWRINIGTGNILEKPVFATFQICITLTYL